MLAFFGALAVWQGFQLMEAGVDIAVIGIIVGGILLLAALAAALKPSPGTMLLEAGAFAAIAAWDLGLAVLSGGEAADLAIWGIVEAGIAVYLFAKLPGFIRIAAEKPSDAVLKQLNELAQSIRKAKVDQEPDLIEFAVGSNRWRARLSEEIAIFLDVKQGFDMLFLTRDDVGLEDRTKPGKDPKSRPVTIRAGQKVWKTKLPREQFERLVAWKQNAAGSVPVDPATGAPPLPAG